MMSVYNPDEYEVLTDHRPCPYHQRNPGGEHPACTCESSITMIKRDPVHCAEVRAARERRHEEQILREADVIRARRAGAI